MSDDFKIERFGRYLLIDHLVDGGMAKICRARFLADQANKIVAIKMIQPQFSNDPAFVQMFKDELKVTFGLIHPNIAQTYDYGEVNQTLYTAMEYVDGQNLKQFLDRLKKRKYVFPVEISTFIISQVCQALFYAHTFADQLTGKVLKIIHRDISPHNIMITYSGAVKVIDFGIAKAETNSESTQAGTIKGKLSYLAPEYLEGHDLDHRYDQFSVGITLWEMLCGRKLFSAANDLAILKEIQNCKVPPPSSINPNVPKELDEIVLTALQKDRNRRFRDMDAFNRALVKFLYSKYPEFNATDLSYFAQELFKEDIKKDRATMREYGKMDISKYIKEYENSTGQNNNHDSSSVIDPSTVEALIVKNRKEEKVELEIDLDEADTLGLTRSGYPTSALRGDKSTVNTVPKIDEHSAMRKVGNRERQAPRRKDATQIAYHAEKKKTSILTYVMAGALGLLVLSFVKPELFDSITGNVTKTEGKKREVASVGKRTADTPEGVLYFENYDQLMEISIDNSKVVYSPLGIKVPIQKKLKIQVNKRGYDSYATEVKIETQGGAYNINIPVLGQRREGMLTTSSDFPSGTRIIYYSNGKRFEEELPLKRYRMPAGNYKAVIVDPERKKKASINLTIEENKEHFLK